MRIKSTAPFIILFFLVLGCAVSDEKNLVAEAIEQGNYNSAYNLALTGAKKGDPELQHAVAMLLSNGYGGDINTDERNTDILLWLNKSAEQGFPDSINWLSDAYKNGWFGLRIDHMKSREWQRKKIQ